MEELPTSGVVGAIRARELLDEVTGVRRRARRPAGTWPPLVVFGVAAVAGAPFVALGGLAVAAWWLFTAPTAFAIVTRYSSRQARARGIVTRSRLHLSLGVAGFAAVWLACLGMAAAHLPGLLGWTLMVAVSYLAWSAFARSALAAIVAIAMAATGTALALSPVPGWTVQLGVGLVMIAGGLVIRYRPETP